MYSRSHNNMTVAVLRVRRSTGGAGQAAMGKRQAQSGPSAVVLSRAENAGKKPVKLLELLVVEPCEFLGSDSR